LFEPLRLLLVQPDAKNVFRDILFGIGSVTFERHEAEKAAALVVGSSERDPEAAGIMRPTVEERPFLADVVPVLGK
jgi:hypothetical protein